jgi:hypothetical protein
MFTHNNVVAYWQKLGYIRQAYQKFRTTFFYMLGLKLGMFALTPPVEEVFEALPNAFESRLLCKNLKIGNICKGKAITH